ncbi:TITAN-like protein isoform X2 [Malania oleifera]|uniref:TITAN-like protein isoform X2 n=1 Tax=Malania oleifera TaxID=397392 RepID=UPI0025AE8574|nr:TITAN-like protein isoform X2 [Malania oleifera]
MENQQTNSPNRSTAKKKKARKEEFEFCEVCNLNHDQGRRHIYFPNHKKSLSSFLSRFSAKLSDVRFFLKNPNFLRPEHASRNRFWCVFCNRDVDELGSSFACSNAIKHLASSDHSKTLKHFFWKYGAGMDSVDSFRISEDDLEKWERKCESLKIEAAEPNEGSCRSLPGPLNDIHNALNYQHIGNFKTNTVYSLESSISFGVVPLPYYTNERYQGQVSHSELSEVAKVGSLQLNVTSSLPVGTQSNTNLWGSKDLAVPRYNQGSIPCNGVHHSVDGYLSSAGVCEHERMVKEQSSSQGLQNINQISPMSTEEVGNVHSGASPPWFDGTEEKKLSVPPKTVMDSLVSSKAGKAPRLNPKRVGAAWAEKRKIELQMEKRGEIVANNFDNDWLPNFGRVWQSGSRKESRKEFEMEKRKHLKDESQSDTSFTIQPYISKRMVCLHPIYCYGEFCILFRLAHHKV